MISQPLLVPWGLGWPRAVLFSPSTRPRAARPSENRPRSAARIGAVLEGAVREGIHVVHVALAQVRAVDAGIHQLARDQGAAQQLAAEA